MSTTRKAGNDIIQQVVVVIGSSKGIGKPLH
jgi:5,10-methylene-tetrahydrofolate dehydrogenase/methenyl tetrahydrofolate cyclohydrolase